ncbi:hypothetical protein ACOI1H_19770 [Loktanella sp. DJP18]|uniref:hypothetical protein n=1 Tax=Loktanella sp. DJP18 TaxID=3409788 RepID=UPI003BB663DD
MDLDKLQKKGAIHIGARSGRIVLYAYSLEDHPGVVSVGWTSKGTAWRDDHPVIADVVSAYDCEVRFWMICHHSSAREIVGKIREGLLGKGMAADAPLGAADKSYEHWFRAGLEDIVFAYPPFAKIFLSEVPSFADEGIEPVTGEMSLDVKLAGSSSMSGRGQRSGAGGGEEESEAKLADALLLKTEGSRSVASLGMIGAIVVGIAYLCLNQVTKTGGGRSFLDNVGSFTGLSFRSDREVVFNAGNLVPDAPWVVSEQGNLNGWYDPARTDDAGRTFGMPKDVQGFRIRTWVDSQGVDQQLYAAYSFNAASVWYPRNVTQIEMSRRILTDLMRIDDMAQTLHADACKVRDESVEAFKSVDIVIVHQMDILAAFTTSSESCERGYPDVIKPRPMVPAAE